MTGTGPRRRSRWLVAIVAAIALTAAACGGDDPPASRSGLPDTESTAAGEPGSGTIDLAAEDIAFSTATLTARAGPVTIVFANNDEDTPHNLHVTGGGVDEKTEIEPGPVTQELSVELDAGTYRYVCDVHPQQMTGELVVE